MKIIGCENYEKVLLFQNLVELYTDCPLKESDLIFDKKTIIKSLDQWNGEIYHYIYDLKFFKMFSPKPYKYIFTYKKVELCPERNYKIEKFLGEYL